ncbi:MAG: DUF3501 family protein [Azospirillum sp.]|nr:DUF3501 family protein [Azospirillum sp.]
MTAGKHEITRADILPMDAYAKIRIEKRKALVPVKRARRVAVGPHATFYFESYDTMWLQIHEMLYIEKGGEDQIPDELNAYNPLVPKGTELVATVMFEIDDPALRKSVLDGIGGVEETMFVQVAGASVKGVAEADVDRTSAAGKASSVQFIHFPFTTAEIEAFRRPNTQVIVGIGHPNYGHMAVMPESVREELAKDFG